MRREKPIAHQLYNYLYPNPTSNDPPTFSAHLARDLVPEVRIEVATFYGDLNSVEARYPGLNYCYPPHRMRLGRFKHHKRLFNAFDALGLTDHEIQDFCCWEGTKWARERYERDEGVKVEDTTGNDIPRWVSMRQQRVADESRRRSITRKTEILVVVEAAPSTRLQANDAPALQEEEEAEMNDAGEAEADGDSEEQRHAAQANRRREFLASYQDLALETARRMNVSCDELFAFIEGRRLSPEIEQRLKEESERRGSLIDYRRVLANRVSNGYMPYEVPTSSGGAVVPRAAA